MSTSRKLPLSYNVETYGNSSRNYTSLATWESDTDNDLVTAAKGEVLECYADSSEFSDYVTIDGATTNSDYYRVIKPATGEEHDGTPNTGVKFDVSGAYAGISIQELYFCVYDLVTRNSGGYCVVINPSNDGHNVVAGCIGKSGNSGYGAFHVQTSSTGEGKYINCIAYGSSNAGFYNYSGTGYFYNCTSYGNNYGFYYYAGAAIAKNCISEQNTTSNWYGTWTTTTCTNNNGVVFKDTSNNDYHLDSSDTAARDKGTDLSNDSVFAFDDDIDRQTRSGTWDIGADECMASITTHDTAFFGSCF